MPNLTLVVSQYMHEVYNYRLRFGTPVQTIRIDRQSQYSVFGPCDVFGYIRWRRNKYGTQDWRIYSAKPLAMATSPAYQGFTPGANVLLALHGA